MTSAFQTASICCQCRSPALYQRGKFKSEKGYCQEHAPADVVFFQGLALMALRSGARKRTNQLQEVEQ